jgi:hypothetical protein
MKPEIKESKEIACHEASKSPKMPKVRSGPPKGIAFCVV